MSKKISRRDFLKISAAGTAAAAVLTGCGTNARFVQRRTYASMPEYTLPGRSTYYASTCRECPAGCGIVVRTAEGRANKVEGNPGHPLNSGSTCARAQAAVQGLYNPDRFQNPMYNSSRGEGKYFNVSWDEAVKILGGVFSENKPDETIFLTGYAPDHLYDLLLELTSNLGMPVPLRFTGLAAFEGRRTLLEAARLVFSENNYPYFDLGNSDVVFSFGAGLTETWLSPVSFSLAYGKMRQGNPGTRGYLVHFEPRMSQTAANADEWIPVRPGSEEILSRALGSLIAAGKGAGEYSYYQGVDLEEASHLSGVSREDLERLAGIFLQSSAPLAIPGGQALTSSGGLETAVAILSLNGLVNNLGQPGGVFLSADAPLQPEENNLTGSYKDLEELIQSAKEGKIKTLLIHNGNPVFNLPPESGFVESLEKIPQIISFGSFLDESTAYADYVLPDHTPLESWGYQRVITGSLVNVLSGSQPVVSPFYNTRSTADVILAALQSLGGEYQAAAPYQDEVEFIQKKIAPLNNGLGYYTAPDENTFWSFWLQSGGWWGLESGLKTPLFDRSVLDMAFQKTKPEELKKEVFELLVYPSSLLSDGRGANRPWLQETPDPMTTVMWNTWVEINPETAHELGLAHEDVVLVRSVSAEIEAVVYVYPAIRPDVIAIPAGQGHTHFGQIASGLGSNPLKLINPKTNSAGDLVLSGTFVEIIKTGRVKAMGRKENIEGVYGSQHP